MKDFPNWLKSIDNGKIGEARTRALLMNKFWILERNIDIEGADFIIQRKILGENFLDRQAPRLGYIQSKFCQNDSTVIVIRKDYIFDMHNNLREEFFLFVHSGMYENEEIFFLNTEQIKNAFKYKNDKFTITFKALEKIKSAKVISLEFVLNKIESNLRQANFKSNRSFYRFLVSDSKDEDYEIDFDYTFPLSNFYGDLTDSIVEIRKKAIGLISDLESDIYTLKDAIKKTNPIEFIEVFENEPFYILENYFYRNEDFFNEDLYNALRSHKKRVELLKGKNFLQNFFVLKKKVSEYIRHEIVNYSSEIKAIICFEIKLNIDKISIISLRHFSEDKKDVVMDKRNELREFYGVLSSEDKYIIYFFQKPLFHSEDTLRRYQRYAIDRFDEKILEDIFGEDALYG